MTNEKTYGGRKTGIDPVLAVTVAGGTMVATVVAPVLTSSQFFGSQSRQVSELLEYGVLALFVVLRFRNLPSFNIDRPSLALFLAAGAFLAIPPLGTRFGWASLGLLVCALGVVAISHGMWRLLPSLPVRKLPWVALAALAGTLLALFVSAVRTLLAGDALGGEPSAAAGGLAGVAILGFLGNLVGPVPVEEVLFRGVIMGRLREGHSRGLVACVAQSLLFLVAHALPVARGSTLWFGPLVGGLLFGALTFNSRSLLPAMVAHAAYNAALLPTALVLANAVRGL